MNVPEFDLFVAHAGPDTDAVRPLVDALRAADPALRVFFDKDDLPLGARWDQFLPTVLGRSRATVLCLSQHLPKATWLASEVVRAIELNKRTGHGVLPIFLDDTPPPYGVDVFHGVSLPRLGVDVVVAKIVGFLSGAAQAPSSPAASPPSAAPPTPSELVAILRRFTAASFVKIVRDAGFSPNDLLPDTRSMVERADNLVSFAEETPAKYQNLIAALRTHGSL